MIDRAISSTPRRNDGKVLMEYNQDNGNPDENIAGIDQTHNDQIKACLEIS